jgi:hypothetical protein
MSLKTKSIISILVDNIVDTSIAYSIRINLRFLLITFIDLSLCF